MPDIHELEKKLSIAGRLKLRPLCVYGADEIPKGAIPSSAIDRCIAKAVYTVALIKKTQPIYVKANQAKCCPGGLVWMGFDEPHPMLKYFVTVGRSDYHDGAAEHLKATPELFDEQRKRIGKITSQGRYIVIGPFTDDIELDKVRSVILFAGSEQIRNLCGLAQFTSSDPFYKTIIPAGSTCSMMITFPAGMAENAPRDAVFIGPTDPTGNNWLSPELMIMGIPVAMAQQMADDLDESFICKRGKIAYPETRMKVNPWSEV